MELKVGQVIRYKKGTRISKIVKIINNMDIILENGDILLKFQTGYKLLYSVKKIDNGWGMQVDRYNIVNLPAGGKFGSESYQVSGGLHWLVISVVYALFEWLKLTISRNKKTCCQIFGRG